MTTPDPVDPDTLDARVAAFHAAHEDEAPQPRITSPEQAEEAGRRHARERGDRLNEMQIVKAAALLRPYWPQIRDERDSADPGARPA